MQRSLGIKRLVSIPRKYKRLVGYSINLGEILVSFVSVVSKDCVNTNVSVNSFFGRYFTQGE